MGIKNYLIEGVSGTGKTSVAEELQKLGYHILHGDRELKYRGDPKTGKAVEEPVHAGEWEKALWRQKHLLWNVEKVQSIISDHTHPVSFFCGGSRNFDQFIDLFDDVFVLNVDDINTLYQRMDERVARDPTDFGGKPEEKKLVAKLHQTQEDIPQNATLIDASMPLEHVVKSILSKCIISK